MLLSIQKKYICTLLQALQSDNATNNSSPVLSNGSSKWPILGSRPNSLSMNNILENAVANMNLHGIFIFI